MTIAFTRFDLRNAFAQGGRVLAPLALVLLVSIAVPNPGIAIAVAVAVGSLAASGPFLADERDHLDTLYATLPVSRSAVVVGRFLTSVVDYLVAAAVATLASTASTVVRGLPVDPGAIAEANALGFLVVSLALSVQLPVFFGVGFSRARLMMYVPIVVLAAAAWGADRLGVLDPATKALTAIDSGVLSAGAVLVGVGLLVASAAVAARLYRRRAL